MGRLGATARGRFRVAKVAVLAVMAASVPLGLFGTAAAAAPSAPGMDVASVAASGGGPWASVTTGGADTCAIRTDRGLWCWGRSRVSPSPNCP